MPSKPSANAGYIQEPKIVADSVHEDIRPSDLEWKIIDRPSFQRREARRVTAEPTLPFSVFF